MPRKAARVYHQLTAEHVLAALVNLYNINRRNRAPRWIGLPEFRVGTGYGRRKGNQPGPEQRIDYFVMSAYRSPPGSTSRWWVWSGTKGGGASAPPQHTTLSTRGGSDAEAPLATE